MWFNWRVCACSDSSEGKGGAEGGRVTWRAVGQEQQPLKGGKAGDYEAQKADGL